MSSIFSAEQLTLGEGSLSHHLRGSLVWCDIEGRAVYERAFDGTETRRFDVSIRPSAAGILDGRTVLLATEQDFRSLDLETGAQEVVGPFPLDEGVRSNDGRIHPCGAFWIGTMHGDMSGQGDIWHLLNGELVKIIEGLVVPNSICFTADGARAYYTDSSTGRIMSVPTDASTGLPRAKTAVFAERGDRVGGQDGSVLDADGQLWNARFGGAAVDVYDAGGNLVASHAVDAKNPTCPAIIGTNLDRLVTTSAAMGIPEAERGPADGTVVELEVDVRGVPEPIAAP